MNGLMLHSGAKLVTMDELKGVATPDATETWTPIPHTTLIDMTVERLAAQGYEMSNVQHSISKEGNRYFGTMELKKGDAYGDYTMIAGIRNSHDKSFPAGLVLGSRVFVCDNLAFSGEVNYQRKHTTHIMKDLPMIMSRALGKLGDLRLKQDQRILAYKGHGFTNMEANDFLIQSYEAKVIPAQIIKDVIHQWKTPNHAEFAPRNAWSLFNAFTEALKGTAADMYTKRTQALHGLMDQFCGISGVKQAEVISEEAYAGA